MKLKGLKKAVGDYRRLNAGGWHSAQYGVLMLDIGTGEIWTDEFYSLGHNSWKEYQNPDIIRFLNWVYVIDEAKAIEIQKNPDALTMSFVKSFVNDYQWTLLDDSIRDMISW